MPTKKSTGDDPSTKNTSSGSNRLTRKSRKEEVDNGKMTQEGEEADSGEEHPKKKPKKPLAGLSQVNGNQINKVEFLRLLSGSVNVDLPPDVISTTLEAFKASISMRNVAVACASTTSELVRFQLELQEKIWDEHDEAKKDFYKQQLDIISQHIKSIAEGMDTYIELLNHVNKRITDEFLETYDDIDGGNA